MTFLPLVERELRVAARLRSTYWIRAITAGVLTAVAVLMLLFGTLSTFQSQAGKASFRTLAFMTMVLCFLEGARRTADCLSAERREGTLGLLFLTDLRGYDVVLGKLAATSLNSFYCLMALLPIIALPLLTGGVTPKEYWRMALALTNILFLSLSVGIWVSAHSRNERNALGCTLLVLIALAGWPYLLQIPSLLPLSPLFAYNTAYEANYLSNASGYWKAILVLQGLSWLLLAWASLVLPSRFQKELIGTSVRWWKPNPERMFGKPEKRLRLRRLLLQGNPVVWLAGRNLGNRVFLWLAVAAALGLVGVFAIVGDTDFLPVYIGIAIVINFMVKIRLGVQSCHCLAEARQNNAMEMLLSTPLTVDQMIQGQLTALKRMFLTPVLLILGIELTGLIGGLLLTDNREAMAAVGVSLFVVSCYLGMFILDTFALIWTGMWFGLSSKNETTAIVKTIGFILLLPHLSFILWCFGLVFFIGWPIFWIVWSSQKLRYQFRNFATTQYATRSHDASWLPPVNIPNQPPPFVPAPR